jgi:hypothetical protein
MLVNTASDLDAVRTNQSGTYALGTKITFDPSQTFAPIPNFTGLFDGQGQTIANLTIATTTQNIGLFGTIASAGEVRNLNLTNVSVSANSSVNSQLVGTLAGTTQEQSATSPPPVKCKWAAEAPRAVWSDRTSGATVPALTQPCIAGQTCAAVAVSVAANASGGGLVGFNSGTITNAFATGDVTGAAGSNGITTLGGLAAVNLGSISNSLASGDVGSPNVANLQAAGLVGNNSGTILSSIALGNVQAGRRKHCRRANRFQFSQHLHRQQWRHHCFAGERRRHRRRGECRRRLGRR